MRMVVSFDEDESQRRSKLGPLLPANGVTQERFGSLMDVFSAGCCELMDAMSGHWEAQCAEQLESHGRKLEALLTRERKAYLKQEIEKQKERADKEVIAKQESLKKEADFKQEIDKQKARADKEASEKEGALK